MWHRAGEMLNLYYIVCTSNQQSIKFMFGGRIREEIRIDLSWKREAIKWTCLDACSMLYYAFFSQKTLSVQASKEIGTALVCLTFNTT